MGKIICVALQKGGQGKSTTSQNLASILGYKGYKVLLLDMDSQANITYSSGADYEYTMTDVLSGDIELRNAITPCKYYDLVASDEYLANLERQEEFRSGILSTLLEEIKEKYDYIVIDTPPSLGNTLIASVNASDYLIIPTEVRPYSYQGVRSLYETVLEANPKIQILGILLIKYNPRTVLNRNIKGALEELSSEMNCELFNTYIRDGIAVPEAQTMQQELIDYAPKSNPCIDYINFADEVLKKLI